MFREDFNNLKPKTMTALAFFQDKVNIDLLFPLLPITPTSITLPKKVSGKYKIPLSNSAGSIISVRYFGHQRGLVRPKKSFKNGITIDIATSEKNVSAKIFKTKIHLCGITSVAMAEESCQFIIQHINKIQQDLDYLLVNEKETQKVLEWVKEHAGGTNILAIDGNMNLHTGHRLQLPQIVPIGLDRQTYQILSINANDNCTTEDFIYSIKWILSQKRVIDMPLEIVCIERAMVNYNYALGFKIDPWALAQHIDGLNGFQARYENAVDRSVMIKLPYEHTSSRLIRRKDRPTCHTFMVYKSGRITQSGPNQELMSGVYYLFHDTIEELKPYIMAIENNKEPQSPAIVLVDDNHYHEEQEDSDQELEDFE